MSVANKEKSASNFYVIISIFLSFIAIVLFFILSTTYRLSLEAKYHYMNDNFEKAYELASEASKKNPYNMMAFSVKEQSYVILKLQDIIKEAKQSYTHIQTLASSKNIQPSDRIRIKFLCEITIDKFDRLKFPLLDKAYLYDEAKQYRNEFEKILKSIKEQIKK